MGRDLNGNGPRRWEVFQFTRPAWGATHAANNFKHFRQVSIHAPRVGRDMTR